MSRQDCVKMDGSVIETLRGDRFRVELENGVTVLGVLSGRMRQKRIRVMTGDRVEMEFSPYDLSRGRISYRYNTKKIEIWKQTT